MAESNATQVILTDDGIKIIKAQSTADNAAGGVANLNDPNLMSVIEKQYNIKQFAGLTSQYNVILARAKEANISTTALTTAYTNLNTFMAAILTDTTKASDVDRDTYKSLTDAYNADLSNVQTALNNNFNTDIANMRTNVSVASQAASSAAIVASQAAITGDNASHEATQAAIAASQAQIAGNNANSVANNASQAASSAVIAGSQATSSANKAITAASQAQSAGNNATSVANNAASVANSATSTADNAFSQAQAVGSQASSEIAVQSTATAKAQSTADNAFSQAVTAIDNANVTSQAVTSLKDGSTLTIAELGNGLATKVSNSEYASYKDQTASQIGQLVTNGAFSAYQQTTADLIASKVATKDFSAYQATTAKSISSKVESSDFNTYKTQTADLISSKVESSNFQALQTQVDNSMVGTNLLTNSNFSDESLAYWTVDPGMTASFDSSGSLVLAVEAASGNRIYYSGSQLLVAGMTYAISFYAYVDSSSTSSSINVKVGPYNNLTSIAVSGTTLARYTGIIKPVSGNSGTLSITVGAFNSGTVGDIVHITRIKLEKGSVATDWSLNPEDQATQSDITQAVNNIHLGFKNPGGSTFQMNLSADGVALMDFSKIMLNGDTNIANGTIGTAQIADASITNVKIGKLAVGTAQIANGAITNAQIGSLAVDTANIKDAAISSAKIANLAVGTAQIGDGAITNAKIGKLAVGTAQIANAAITDAQVGNVSANKLTAGTIDFNTITGKNINASNITTGTLNTNRLNVGKLSALSADLGNVTTGSLKGVDIVAKTFSTPNGSFTTNANGAITAKNMTLVGGTLTSPTINASTINGATLNMQTDGLINSPYNGIEQSADNFYHPWKLNTGQLTIGQGYITSVSSGTRSINGIPKQFNHVQGTLSASYLKFTNDYGARTYIDADMFTYSNQTNDTAMVTISAGGVGINMGTMSAPALTISNGYIDASSSSSYGVFGSITLGYSPHTINSDSSLFFESGHGSGNPGINIWAKGFHSLSSRLSTKRQVRLLDDEHSNSLLLGADTATFQYNQDTNADNSNEGVIIDDVNTAKQYSLPDELMTRDGKAPTDLMSFIARVISQNKYQARLIEDLQIRLRKVEINNG